MVLYLSLSDPAPTCSPSKKSCFEIFLNGMKPNSTPGEGSEFTVFFLTHPDLQRSVFFFFPFPHPLPTYPLPSSFPSLFPLIIIIIIIFFWDLFIFHALVFFPSFFVFFFLFFICVFCCFFCLCFKFCVLIVIKVCYFHWDFLFCFF